MTCAYCGGEAATAVGVFHHRAGCPTFQGLWQAPNTPEPGPVPASPPASCSPACPVRSKAQELVVHSRETYGHTECSAPIGWFQRLRTALGQPCAPQRPESVSHDLRQVQMYVDAAFGVLTVDDGNGLKPRTSLLDAEALSDAAESLAHAANLLAKLRAEHPAQRPELPEEPNEVSHNEAARFANWYKESRRPNCSKREIERIVKREVKKLD